MLKINKDAIIVRPEDLANAYGSHLLIIGEDGSPEPGTDVPEQIYVRYEPSKELLYIDRRIFKWLDLKETLDNWRKSQQWCGPMVKRMASGTGKVLPPVQVVVFDLSEKPEERKSPIKPRRGRPMEVEKRRALEAVAKVAEQKTVSAHRKLLELRTEYGNLPVFKDIELIIKEAKHILEEAHAVVSGKRRTRGPNKKTYIPIDERPRIEGLDTLIKDNIHAIHRILRRYVKTGGKQKFEDKDIRPRIPPTDWIGRYEEVSNEETGHTTKLLYIPVSVLKSMSELADYKKDYRYVKKKYRQIGGASLSCAVFDFARRPPQEIA